MAKLMKLFEPGKIGKLELKNRIVMAPLGVGYATPEGYNTERYTTFLAQRAKGGVGLIFTGVTKVGSEVAGLPGCLGIYDDRMIPGFQQLAQAIKPYGTKIFMQLHHPGTRGSERGPLPTVAPSAIPNPKSGVVPKELTKEDIQDLIEKYGQAARRVKEAGFDGVEVHGAHGYLLCQFLSPRTNRRTDEYGGSVENRTRFACEILRRVREVVGPEYPVTFRMDGDEFMDGGITLDDAVRQAPFFVEAGADAIGITGGCSQVLHYCIGNYIFPMGYLVSSAAEIKKMVSVPVIAAARLGDPILAERTLAEGKADFIVMGRSLLADPELPNKAKEGRFDDIRPCIYCNVGCSSETMNYEGYAKCAVNPACGREMEYRLEPTKKPKKVMVIGGGLAGMEAARTLAERGHEVSLYEKADRLGGQWGIVSSVTLELSALTDYLSRGLQKAGVKVALNTEVDAQLVQQVKPDAVVVATGASQILPDIPGIDQEKVVMANDVLVGKVNVGQEVVVIGGRLVGTETALFLAKQAKKVSVVDQVKILENVGRTFKLTLMEQLVKYGVYIYPDSPLHSVVERGVYIINNGELVYLRADTVVIAVGSKAEDRLAQELKSLVPEVYTIGDCVEPRDVLSAIHEGSKVGRELL